MRTVNAVPTIQESVDLLQNSTAIWGRQHLPNLSGCNRATHYTKTHPITAVRLTRFHMIATQIVNEFAAQR
jgi:hypothetical protein